MKKTSIIEEQMKMADVIHLDYNLLPVINRFGISLGFGEKTVKEMCLEKDINMSFFLEVLNTFHDPDYFPKANLVQFPVNLLLDYLKKTHTFYLDNKVPQIEKLIQKLIKENKDLENKMGLIEKFFYDYRNELIEHIMNEEEKVYPYISHLEMALSAKTINSDLKQQISRYSIGDFKDEHDNVEEKLNDLKNIMIKYLPEPANNYLCNDILFLLFELEKDLTDHARMEDVILVPVVAAMEEEYKKRLENE